MSPTVFVWKASRLMCQSCSDERFAFLAAKKNSFCTHSPLAPRLTTTISIYKHSASLFLRRGTFKFSSLRPCVYVLYFTPPRQPSVQALECFTHVLTSWCITLGRITLSCRDLIPYTGISHLNEYETFTGLH